jgi:predicted amidohydrolase
MLYWPPFAPGSVMTDLDICAAQYCAVAGDLKANLDRHAQAMRLAANQGVGFLMFPELSLTGYEPPLASNLALTADAQVLQPLRELARQLRMTTVVGVPLRQAGTDDIFIGALVFCADGSQITYTKQHLHPGEETVFTPGQGGPMVTVDSEHIALSVCADFSHASHAHAAAQEGAGIYAASVLISENGYARDSGLMQAYARQYAFGVLIANHGGPSGGWACAGRSAFWSPDGKPVVAATGTGDCLVIARRRSDVWQGEVLSYSLNPSA